MPATTKRIYRDTTDQIILDLIEAGKMKVNTKKGVVYYFHTKKRRWVRRTTYPDSSHRYLRCRLQHNGAKRSPMLHRIVWIAANMQLIPEGYEIHHGEKGRLCNSIDNLTALSKEEHFLEHYGYPPSWDVEEF